MPQPVAAKWFIAAVWILGIAALVEVLPQGTASPMAALVFVLASVPASMLKVKLPGVTSAVSAGFSVVLLAIAVLDPAAVVLVAFGSALVQCLWRPARGLSWVQVSFSVAATTVSARAADIAAHQLAGNAAGAASAVVMAAVMLFFINSGFVAMVVSLTEGASWGRVWGYLNLWSLPYYCSGAMVVTAALGLGAATTQLAIVLGAAALLHGAYRQAAVRWAHVTP